MNGSFTIWANAAATAASNALPPPASTEAPTSAARGCGQTTTPFMAGPPRVANEQTYHGRDEVPSALRSRAGLACCYSSASPPARAMHFAGSVTAVRRRRSIGGANNVDGARRSSPAIRLPFRNGGARAAMKITDLTVTLFAWDGLPPRQFGRHTGRMTGGSSQLGLVTIHTDEGVEGHAFLGSSNRGANYDAASLIRYLKPVAMGENPLDRERIYQRMWPRNRNTTLRCIGAVDIALWDIAGKVAGLPLDRLLGSFRDAAPAYASSEVLPSQEAYAEEALRIKEAGFHAYKMHPPAVWQED